jgi:hypothetical protein
MVLQLYKKHGTHTGMAVTKSNMFLGARKPGSRQITFVVGLNYAPAASCLYASAVNAKEVSRAYVYLHKEGYIPCCFIRILDSRIPYEPFGSFRGGVAPLYHTDVPFITLTAGKTFPGVTVSRMCYNAFKGYIHESPRNYYE